MDKDGRNKLRPYRNPVRQKLLLITSLVIIAAPLFSLDRRDDPLLRQTPAEEKVKSAGCLTCHTDIEPMHASPNVRLGCTDCHGGHENIELPAGAQKGGPEYERVKQQAHPKPTYPKRWPSAANPVRPYSLTLKENKEWIRFVNPGDFRVVDQTCGRCHTSEAYRSPRSVMTHVAPFWGAAAYNNGIVAPKLPFLGESYSPEGIARKLTTVPPPSAAETKRGIIPVTVPLPRWNITQPGDIAIRSFERGGRVSRIDPSEIGNPNLSELDDPGRPDMKLSDRGLGTQLLISSPVLNIHKTRLNDPHLSLFGTNDHAGDYRSSGCTACHVIYGNDRDPEHSGPYAKYGHNGTSSSKDPTIPKNESGHPIQHRLTNAIPTSQCMVCHMHQPNAFVNTYLGYQMWDYESDGEFFYPKKQQQLTPKERTEALESNPEGAVIRGLWNDPKFLNHVSELNPKLKTTQFADYHGHGWNFRAVFNKDRRGNLLDASGHKVSDTDPAKFKKAVHLKDIHLEKGMHCVDCHFNQDAHGDGKLYGAYADAVAISCVDCHGTFRERAKIEATGPAGQGSLADTVTTFGKRRFVWRGGELIQRSSLYADKEWAVPQVVDSITPGSTHFNPKAYRAKTIVASDGHQVAHDYDKMTCYTCHTSFVTNCFGCHLPQKANEKREMKHFEGETSRNWTSYNPQVLRDEGYMLGKWGPSKGGKIAPVRSSSALLISSMNANREQIYFEQAPISTPGYSSQAFNPHYPHAVRKTETKTCTDCHISDKNDNNAWMSQLLLFGTNMVNFMGRYAYVGLAGEGYEAVKVIETEEPQAVIGSYLQSLAYPADYQKHLEKKSILQTGYHHHGDTINCLQLRGEYLYAANGQDGLRVYDVANVDNKGFSERTVTSPVSPLGQQTHVASKEATCVALPTNMPIDPTRKVAAENQEQAWHPLYHYAYVSDREEGLIVVNVDTLADGNPRNNFLKRALTYNPDNLFHGARYLTVAGDYLYLIADSGLSILSIDNPLQPKIIKTFGAPFLNDPRVVAIQFRYAFVGDADGLKVIDITMPEKPTPVTGVVVPVKDLHDLYLARTDAYVAAGPEGILIIDITRPTAPKLAQKFSAEGQINDARSVRVAATNASFFAYVADGKNGLRVIQLTSPKTPGYYGFAPIPQPKLIATYPTKGPAIALSKGLDRDRAVDESGHQVSIFGRMGSRPFTLEEMRQLFMKNGHIYTVHD